MCIQKQNLKNSEIYVKVDNINVQIKSIINNLLSHIMIILSVRIWITEKHLQMVNFIL